MPDKTYELLIANMPVGLDRAIMRVISRCQGRDQSISRGKLLTLVHAAGFQDTNERQMRESIKMLRRDGHLICSAPGTGGGYWLAVNMAEYQEFEESEYTAKIVDMSETRAAMRKSARAQFNEGVQVRLI